MQAATYFWLAGNGGKRSVKFYMQKLNTRITHASQERGGGQTCMTSAKVLLVPGRWPSYEVLP